MNRARLSAAVAAMICIAAPSLLAAAEDEPIRPRFSLSLGLVGGVEPLHGNLPDETALLYGGDVRLRLAVISLGVRLEKTAGFSPAGVDGFTRLLGTLGFNIGLGNRTALSPYLGFGTAVITGSSYPAAADARVGFEVEHFLALFLSIGAGLALDLRAHGEPYGFSVSAALSGVCRLGVHLPLG